MPNWIEGTLKVRGNLENVKRFIIDGLNEYTLESAYRDNPTSKPKESWLEIEDNKEYGYYEININSESEPYVEGTKRAFVSSTNCSVLYYESEWKDPAIAVMKVRQAWDFPEEEWTEIAKKYNVDLRLYGIERGMQFCQELEIIKGEVKLSKEKKYKNWDWECPFPYLGG